MSTRGACTALAVALALLGPARVLAAVSPTDVLERYRAGEATSVPELMEAAAAARTLARTEPALHHTALRIYQAALAVDPGSLEARTTLGELLLEKYNGAEATEVFREVLERDSTYVPALLGLARTQHFERSSEAVETVLGALEIDPDHVPSRAFLARLLLEVDAVEESVAEAERALAVAPDDVPALTILAAARFMQDDSAAFDALLDRIAELAPGDAGPLVTLAEIAAQNRRYAEAARFAARGVRVDRSEWRAHALLGLNLLRAGEMDAGRESLERAFRGDPFDLWTKNSLDLLDMLGEFESHEAPPFEIVAHPDESRALLPWLAPLAGEAYAYFADRYGARPPGQVRIEVYPRHEDLSVRTVGLVGVDILGVSFGPVVAMDSPSARRSGEFNWGSTLWHELAHTFHLHISNQRAPRWLSEGLAVHEERLARPGWGADPSPDFLTALRDGRLPRLASLDLAFVRPAYPEQIVHAYYLASVVVELIERDHGVEALVAMLRAYGEGEDAEAVVARVLGTDLESLDTLVFAELRERHAAALAALTEPDAAADPLTSYPGALALGAKRLDAGDSDGALQAFERARALFPEHASPGSARARLAALYEQRGETDRAIAELVAIVDIDGDTLEPHLRLAELAARSGDDALAADALERAVYIDPFDIDVHLRLAELHERAQRWRSAAQALEAVVALGPRDPVVVRHRLARALVAADELPAARRALLAALESAPMYGPGLELLLEIRERMSAP